MRVGYGKPKNETVGPSAEYREGPNASSVRTGYGCLAVVSIRCSFHQAVHGPASGLHGAHGVLTFVLRQVGVPARSMRARRIAECLAEMLVKGRQVAEP